MKMKFYEDVDDLKHLWSRIKEGERGMEYLVNWLNVNFFVIFVLKKKSSCRWKIVDTALDTKQSKYHNAWLKIWLKEQLLIIKRRITTTEDKFHVNESVAWVCIFIQVIAWKQSMLILQTFNSFQIICLFILKQKWVVFWLLFWFFSPVSFIVQRSYCNMLQY